ncbi:MAG: DUF1573 domain-containing protein [Verrucomicrobia bacterium]|nr:DUF1573 domain-containing protein [Verrucomicrobiota bacterium]
MRRGSCLRDILTSATMLVALCVSAAGAEPTSKPPQPPPLPLLPPGAEQPGVVRPVRPPAPKARPALNTPGAVPQVRSVANPRLDPPLPLPPQIQSSTPVPFAPPGFAVPGPSAPPQPLLPSNSLSWDAESKEFKAKAGETNAYFTFYLTNVCDKEVLVNGIRTSCGCTAAKLPSTPWKLAPGEGGPISVTMDIRGKHGRSSKSVTVDTTAGTKSLLVTAIIPQPEGDPTQMNRSQNMQLAMTDRQVVFRGDCAKCHVEPGVGKMGKELYTASCGICHEAEHRASMVTDLKTLKHSTNLEYWTHWIREGKPGSLMPAFSAAHGGPLTEPQIASLAQWLTENYKGGHQTAAAPAPAISVPASSKPASPLP